MATEKNVEQVNGKYENALQLLFYEGQIAWQMNLLFIGLNVGIGTIIGDKLDDLKSHFIILIIMSAIGCIINYFWLGTFKRNNRYYHFRMAQAREAEPIDWKLLRDRGYRFSKGESIAIRDKEILSNDEIHQLKNFERKASNKTAIKVTIWIFLISYLGLFLASLICKLISL